MLSNRDSKFIKSLQLKKFRQSEGLFVVEGAKNVLELLKSDFEITQLLTTQEFAKLNPSYLNNHDFDIVKEKELEKIGSLKSNNAALGVAKIPKHGKPSIHQDCTLAFDRINDPGNLGTIIRIADWYGIRQIICSPDSVDCFNPKVISATMGSFTRVKVFYDEIGKLMEQIPNSYATALDGASIYEMPVTTPAVILFGNESSGLNDKLLSQAKHRIKIPGDGGAESLNVGVSVGIFCDNFMRRMNESKQ